MQAQMFGPGSQTPENSAGEPVQIQYVEQPGLLGISIANFFLNLITLTIYRFWAKTRVRRHIWSCIHVNNEPVEYTGTGKELFFGFLIIFLVLFLPIGICLVALQFYLGPEHWGNIAATYLIAFVLLTLYGFAIYRARRYRLSRTLWRGIRGALPGSALTYSAKYFGALLLAPMTLGWSRPAMNLLLAEQMHNDMRFGNTPFNFSGRAGPLYARYAVCWFLTLGVYVGIVALGIGLYSAGAFDWVKEVLDKLDTKPGQTPAPGTFSAVFGLIGLFILLWLVFISLRHIIWALYTARELNVFTEYTRFPGLTFKFDATAWSLITLWLGNMALIIFTLGIASPFAEQRVMRYFVERLSVNGRVDFNAIRQSQAQIDSRGEGLIDALDLDAF